MVRCLLRSVSEHHSYRLQSTPPAAPRHRAQEQLGAESGQPPAEERNAQEANGGVEVQRVVVQTRFLVGAPPAGHLRVYRR